jgi:hypothetical protein
MEKDKGKNEADLGVCRASSSSLDKGEIGNSCTYVRTKPSNNGSALSLALHPPSSTQHHSPKTNTKTKASPFGGSPHLGGGGGRAFGPFRRRLFPLTLWEGRKSIFFFFFKGGDSQYSLENAKKNLGELCYSHLTSLHPSGWKDPFLNRLGP